MFRQPQLCTPAILCRRRARHQTVLDQSHNCATHSGLTKPARIHRFGKTHCPLRLRSEVTKDEHCGGRESRDFRQPKHSEHRNQRLGVFVGTPAHVGCNSTPGFPGGVEFSKTTRRRCIQFVAGSYLCVSLVWVLAIFGLIGCAPLPDKVTEYSPPATPQEQAQRRRDLIADPRLPDFVERFCLLSPGPQRDELAVQLSTGFGMAVSCPARPVASASTCIRQ